MPYGTIKVDTITFTAGGADTSVSISGLVQNPTFTGNITTTGTVTAATVVGTTTVSGATVTGTQAQFTVITGGTAGFTTITGTTVTGTTANFATVSGTTVTGTTGNFGGTVTAATVVGTTTVSGATVTGNAGSFTTVTGGVATITSGVFALGTAALPSISFSSDPNTGIYSPGADQVAISTGGSGRLRVSSTGTVEIVGAGAIGSTQAVSFNGSAPVNSMVLDSSGRLGVGTSNPQAKLDIASTYAYGTAAQDVVKLTPNFSGGTSSSASSMGSILWGYDDGTTNLGRINVVSNNPSTTLASSMQFWIHNGSSFSQSATLTPTGLGIGTSSPSALLHVLDSSSTTTTPLILRNYAASVNTKVRIALQGQTASNQGANAFIQSLSGTDAGGSNSNNDSGLQFIVTNGGGATENQAMTINTQGRVGIGVTAPIAQTHIRLSAVTGYTSPSNDGLVLERGGGNDVAISIATDNTRNGYLIFADGDSANPAWVGYDHSANAMSFRVNASERARIDSSGRLLVGTSSNTRNTTIVAQGHSGNSTGPAHVRLNRGDDSPTTGNPDLGYLFFGTSDNGSDGGAWILGQRDGGTWSSTSKPGRLVFSTTADGASSPTEAMRISRFQDVGIGVAPSAGLRLQVKGVDGSSSNSALYVTDSSNAMLCQIRNDGAFYTGLSPLSPYNLTTASAANCAIISDGTLRRSTSSIQYKTNIETLSDNYADAILKCRPVWYRSTAPGDTAHPNWGYWGFIAEEVAEVDPRLVFWKTHETKRDEDGKETSVELEKPLAEGVQYDRFVPHLLNLIKRQQQAIEDLQAEVAALKAQ